MGLDRTALQEYLSALAKADAAIDTASAPFRAAQSAIAEVRDLLLEGCPEIVGTCEGCDIILFEGDPGHRYEDGPVTCEKCSPEYGDCLAQLKERMTDPTEDDPSELRADIVLLEERIAAGLDPHMKAVSEL